MRRALRHLLRGFAGIWVVGVFLLWLASMIGIVLSSPDLLAAWGRISEVMSPFNIANYIVTVVLLSPALGANWLASKLQEHGLRGENAAPN